MTDDQLRRLLLRFVQQADNLLQFQAVEAVVVDGQDLVPRHHAGPRGRRIRQRLQHQHAAGQDGDHGAETFPGGGFHLLQLPVLIRIEEGRVRIEMAKHAGDDALVEGLVDIDGVRRAFLQNAEDVDEALHGGFVGFRIGRSRRAEAGQEDGKQTRDSVHE